MSGKKKTNNFADLLSFSFVVAQILILTRPQMRQLPTIYGWIISSDGKTPLEWLIDDDLVAPFETIARQAMASK